MIADYFCCLSEALRNETIDESGEKIQCCRTGATGITTSRRVHLGRCLAFLEKVFVYIHY